MACALGFAIGYRFVQPIVQQIKETGVVRAKKELKPALLSQRKLMLQGSWIYCESAIAMAPRRAVSYPRELKPT